MPKILWSKLHSHMIESWKWMEGQILTGRWLRCDRTLAAGSGQFIWPRRTSLVWPDAGRSMWPNAEGQRPVNSSKGPDLRKCDRTRPVSGDRTLSIQRPVVYSKHPRSTGRVRSVLTGPCQRPVITWKLLRGLNWPKRPVNMIGASGHPAEAHNGSFFRLPYK